MKETIVDRIVKDLARFSVPAIFAITTTIGSIAAVTAFIVQSESQRSARVEFLDRELQEFGELNSRARALYSCVCNEYQSACEAEFREFHGSLDVYTQGSFVRQVQAIRLFGGPSAFQEIETVVRQHNDSVSILRTVVRQSNSTDFEILEQCEASRKVLTEAEALALRIFSLN